MKLMLNFCNQESRNVDAWRNYHKLELPGFEQTGSFEALTPLFGTADYAKLSEEEKRSLFFSFVSLNAEAFATLELLLKIGFKRLRERLLQSTSTENELKNDLLNGVNKFIFEEHLHSKAFFSFLRKEKQLAYPQKSIFKNKWKILRRLMILTAHYFPLSLALPGAKVEAYSVCYAQFLKGLAMQNVKSNRYVYLHHLHQLDEAHHIPFQFGLYNSLMKRSHLLHRLYDLFGTLLFIALLQVMHFQGCREAVNLSFKNLSRLQTLKMIIRIGKWNLRLFQPYIETRKMTARYFSEMKPWAGQFLRFIYR